MKITSKIAEDSEIASDVTIGDFVTISSKVEVGAASKISSNVYIGENCRIGQNVTVNFGSYLAPNTVIGAGSVIGTNVSFVAADASAGITLDSNVLVGSGATILAKVHINQGAVIGAGSVVTRNIPANGIARGNPARINGYNNIIGHEDDLSPTGSSDSRLALAVNGSYLYKVPNFRDLRGSLNVMEFEKDLPFKPERCFFVYDVPTKDIRGEHAHKSCEQFLICLSGTIKVLLDDGRDREEIVLNSPNTGLHMPAGIWGSQYGYSKDSLMLVFASEKYDHDDYIRTYGEFMEYIGSRDK